MLIPSRNVNTPRHVRLTSDATPTFVRLVKFCYLCNRENISFYPNVRRACAHMYYLKISIQS